MKMGLTIAAALVILMLATLAILSINHSLRANSGYLPGKRWVRNTAGVLAGASCLVAGLTLFGSLSAPSTTAVVAKVEASEDALTQSISLTEDSSAVMAGDSTISSVTPATLNYAPADEGYFESWGAVLDYLDTAPAAEADAFIRAANERAGIGLAMDDIRRYAEYEGEFGIDSRTIVAHNTGTMSDAAIRARVVSEGVVDEATAAKLEIKRSSGYITNSTSFTEGSVSNVADGRSQVRVQLNPIVLPEEQLLASGDTATAQQPVVQYTGHGLLVECGNFVSGITKEAPAVQPRPDSPEEPRPEPSTPVEEPVIATEEPTTPSEETPTTSTPPTTPPTTTPPTPTTPPTTEEPELVEVCIDPETGTTGEVPEDEADQYFPADSEECQPDEPETTNVCDPKTGNIIEVPVDEVGDRTETDDEDKCLKEKDEEDDPDPIEGVTPSEVTESAAASPSPAPSQTLEPEEEPGDAIEDEDNDADDTRVDDDEDEPSPSAEPTTDPSVAPDEDEPGTQISDPSSNTEGNGTDEESSHEDSTGGDEESSHEDSTGGDDTSSTDSQSADSSGDDSSSSEQGESGSSGGDTGSTDDASTSSGDDSGGDAEDGAGEE